MIIKRAILLAAGLGTRLRPLTNSMPKCLVSLNNKPLLQIWLENLSAAGTSAFLVNTHYLSDQVNVFIENSEFRNQINVTYEPNLLGTAGTLKHNLDFFNQEDGLLIHADNFCLANLPLFYKAHKNRPKGCVLTMMTFRTDKPSECGIVELDKNGVVIGFHEKVLNPPGNLANGAVYILSIEFLDMMHREFSDATDFSTEILGQLTGKIYSYETQEIFMDIGTPEMYARANQLAV